MPKNNTEKSPWTIYLVNKSSKLDDATGKKIAYACDRQLKEDVAPIWELLPMDVKYATEPVQGQYNILFLDDLDEPDAAGWHTDDQTGIHGEVGVNVWLDHGGSFTEGYDSISCTTSHEVLELFVDRNANAWRDTGHGWLMIQEVCDSVQSSSYEMDGIAVSNFLYPEYFDPTPYDDKYDHLDRLDGPFTLDEGGYFVYMEGGRTGQQFSETVPQWKRELKQKEVARGTRVINSERCL